MQIFHLNNGILKLKFDLMKETCCVYIILTNSSQFVREKVHFITFLQAFKFPSSAKVKHYMSVALGSSKRAQSLKSLPSGDILIYLT